ISASRSRHPKQDRRPLSPVVDAYWLRHRRKATRPPVYGSTIGGITAKDYRAIETDEAVPTSPSARQPAIAALNRPSVISTKRMRFIKAPCPMRALGDIEQTGSNCRAG